MNEKPEVKSVPSLDLQRYLGTWFEIGRLPLRYEDDDAVDVTATYSLEKDGTVRVDNRCLDKDGKPTQALGKGIPDEEHDGRLEITFLPEGLRWIPFTKADYWVIKIDDNYEHALVGTPDNKHLWLLSRTHRMPEDLQRVYLAEAVSQGFDLENWIRTLHSGNQVSDTAIAEA